MQQYKLIAGFSTDSLEKNINFFLATLDTRTVHVEFVGAPQMFGHSDYVQALEVFTHVD